MICYRVLGPLQVERDGERVELVGGRPRMLLALFLLHGNEPMSAERLTDMLWDDPPASSAKIIQNCVVQLRRLLPADTLVTRRRGYELRLTDDALDANVFRNLAARGRAQLEADDPDAAVALYDEALQQWHGSPLWDVGEAPFTESAVQRLNELRLEAVLGRSEALLRLGREADAVTVLEAEHERDRLDERVAAQLMLALYRSGRQADALTVYRDTRRGLVDELAVEPGSALREMEKRILRQERDLEGPRLSPPSTQRRGRARLGTVLLALAAAVAIAAAAAALLRPEGHGAEPASASPPNSVVVVNASTARIDTRLAVGASPIAAVAAAGKIYVANQQDGTVSIIDAKSRRQERTIAIANFNNITSLAQAGDAVWVVDSVTGSLIRIGWPFSGTERIVVPIGPASPTVSDYLTLAGSPNHLWITSARGRELIDVDARAARIGTRVALPGTPTGAAVAGALVWCAVSNGRKSAVLGFDPETHALRARVPLPAVPTAVAAGRGRLWVVASARDTVFEIDPRLATIDRTLRVPGGPVAVAADRSGIWVIAAKSHSLLRLDSADGVVTGRVGLRTTPHVLTLAAGRVWVLGA